MVDYIKRLFNKNKDNEVSLNFKGEIKFTLSIKELIIGTLFIEENLWKFSYSEEFKEQTKFRKLAGFSDLNKVYESRILWPFFKIRIPGLKQPMIIEIIEQENLDKDNEAALLQRFGRKVVSNPYILELKTE